MEKISTIHYRPSELPDYCKTTDALDSLDWVKSLFTHDCSQLTALCPPIPAALTRIADELSDHLTAQNQDPFYTQQIHKPSVDIARLVSQMCLDSYDSRDVYPNRLWEQMVTEADIVKYKLTHRTRMTGLTNWLDENRVASLNTHKPFCQYIFVSPGVDPDAVRSIVNQYQQSFTDTCDFLQSHPEFLGGVVEHLYQISRENYLPIRNLALGSPEFIASIPIGCMIFLNDEDCKSAFDHKIRDYQNGRIWVDDATLADALLITPAGWRNLSKSSKLIPNALHEIVHIIIHKFRESVSGYSSQYLFPFWLKEGIANTLMKVLRGRQPDDGFRLSQKQHFEENPLKTASDIMSDPHANYVYYQLWTFYLFAACDSARRGYKYIQFPTIDEQPKIYTDLFQDVAYTFSCLPFPYPYGVDAQNKIAAQIFNRYLEEYGKNFWRGINLEMLKSHFDLHVRQIGKIYFEKQEQPEVITLDYEMIHQAKINMPWGDAVIQSRLTNPPDPNKSSFYFE